MKTIFISLLQPERMGARGLRWFIMADETIIITNIAGYCKFIEKEGQLGVDFKIESIEPKMANEILNREMSKG